MNGAEVVGASVVGVVGACVVVVVVGSVRPRNGVFL